MQYQPIPSVFLYLKKRFDKSHIIKTESEDIFFAIDKNAIEDIAIKKYKSFIKDGGFKRLKYVLGDGLLTGEDPKHMEHKREMSSAFNNSKLKEYEPRLQSIIESIVSNWQDKIDVQKEMSFVVFKSVMEIFFSENIDDDFNKIKSHILNAADKISLSMLDDELDNSTKELKSICNKIVDKRIASKENKDDLLGLLINSYYNNKMTLNDVYEEAITILLSSYETTAYVLEWSIYYLSINPYWQKEISEGRNIDAFINEVLRMCPPVWNSERIAIEDVEIDGIKISAGTKVIMSSLATHRDKAIFEDPDTFKPERWFDIGELPKGAYFPFLIGKRQCIGKEFALMEIKLLLITVTKMFDISHIGTKPYPIGRLTYRNHNKLSILVKKKSRI